MFELFLTMLEELFLPKVVESFWSKVVEKMADNAVNSAQNIKDFELILKTLEENLKLLSAKACDVEEETTELSGKKRKREVEEWLEQVKSIEKEVDELMSGVESQEFMMRLMGGGEAAKLNEQVEKLVEQSRNFGEFQLVVRGTRGETSLTKGMIGEAFNINSETIMKLLETKEVSRIGIYGMGGVGKTTLAKHIHNQLLQQSPGCVFWVTVSQEFTIKSLQDKIARFIDVDLLDEDDEDIRAVRLQRALSQQKHSVLILDDVWEEIDMIKLGYCVSDECCRLIITSRSLEVCCRIPCQKFVSVGILPEDEAWRLFSEKLGNVMELAPQVVEIAKSMAKLCGGLPLGIITVAGTMMGETSIHTWRYECQVLKERYIGQDDMGDIEVYKVLKYSFDRLNRNHQSQSHEFNTYQLCFMYFSLYPEDHVIRRGNLVRKFISEGLLDERNRRREQVDLGHRILDKLVNDSLLESCFDLEDFKCVKMHNLVRGMALKINEGKYMVALDKLKWTKGLEKVSLVNSGIKSIVDGISPDCPKLSTLMLYSYELEVIPDSFFSKMQGLCTLDVCETRIRMLPDSVSDLKSLKALLLENCRKLEYVPYLGKLKALRELNLSGTAIKEVPQGVEELLNLKFLSLDADALVMFPSGMLLKLVHLQHVNLPLHIPMEGIENLKWLEELKGRVENVSDFNCLIKSWGSQAHDSCYSIIVGSFTEITEGYLEDRSFGFVESSLGSTYKKKLIVCKCNLEDEMLLGQDIEYLVIERCEGLSACFVDDLLRLNNPTSLKELTISHCGEMKCISRSEQGLPFQISSLVDISLEYLDDLEEVFQRGEIGLSNAPTQAVFSSLKFLRIRGCNKMSKLGLPVSGVPNLESLDIVDCREIKEIFEDEGRGSVTLPRLVWLNLGGLPRLEIVCKTAMICNSISVIWITGCPRLMKKLPVHMDDLLPPHLKQIVVGRKWWESLEWENPDLPQHLHDGGFLKLLEVPAVRPRPFIGKGKPVLPQHFRDGGFLYLHEKDLFHEREELMSPVKKKAKNSMEDEDGVYDVESSKDPTRGVPHAVPERCIEHCKLFLPDCQFEKDKLVRMWIAEECIELGVTKRMEDVGYLYFDALVQEEIIVPSKFDNVHRQMKYKFNTSRLSDDLLKQVHEDCSASISQLSNGIFLGLRLLRTLDLSRTHISEVPGSIGKLESLKYLDISETPIKRLPESLDSLYRLQTLNLKACPGISTLPRGFGRLVNLHHLDLDIVSQLKSMPRGMGNLIKLQTLRAFIVGKNDGCGIQELKNMNEITGSFCISRLENISNSQEAKEAALWDKSYIDKLELRWNSRGNDNFQDTAEILESLRPHSNLKELQLTFFGGSKLPRWISNPAYTDLSSITLYKCINCDILPSIGMLPSLKILHIVNMENLKNIDTVFCRNHESKLFNAFPRLEKLILDSMPALEEWTGVEDGDFPCLRQVSIKYCPKLRVLPSLSHLCSLEHFEISNCMQLISLPEGPLPGSLESLIIRGCPGLNERCRKDGGVDWSKISSVGNIWIDLEKISLD